MEPSFVFIEVRRNTPSFREAAEKVPLVGRFLLVLPV